MQLSCFEMAYVILKRPDKENNVYGLIPMNMNESIFQATQTVQYDSAPDVTSCLHKEVSCWKEDPIPLGVFTFWLWL